MTTFERYPQRRPSGLPMVLAGAAFVMAAWMVVDRSGWLRPAPNTTPRAVTPRGELAPMEQDLVALFARTSPAVAHITTQSLVRRGFSVGTQEGTGSGFVWDDAGTIVTNYHVVRGADRVEVVIDDRQFTARTINGDAEFDLAVLRLEGDIGGLAPIPLGSSGDLRVGQMAIAIGNPFGFDQTLTTGVVSALGRNIKTEDGRILSGLIQVDAAINPGNSGGPLLDSAGRLIGVTTAIFSPSGANAGLGFAVPVDVVNEVVPHLLEAAAPAAAVAPTGRPVLGVRNTFAHPGLRTCRLDGLELEYRRGAVVTEVEPGSGAARAGIAPFEFDEKFQPVRWGDVIVAVDGILVREFNDLRDALLEKRPGQIVRVTVVRGLPDRARVEDVAVTLGSTDQ